jgi:hypothetical protein
MCGVCCVVPATECSDSGNTNDPENNVQNFMAVGRYGGGSNSIGTYDEGPSQALIVRTICEVDLLGV